MSPDTSSSATTPLLSISPSGAAAPVDMPMSRRRASCSVAAPLSLTAFSVVVSGTTRSRRRSSGRHSRPEQQMPNSHVLSSCSCSPPLSFLYRRTHPYGTPRVIHAKSARSDSVDGKTHDKGNAATSSSVVCRARPPFRYRLARRSRTARPVWFSHGRQGATLPTANDTTTSSVLRLRTPSSAIGQGR